MLDVDMLDVDMLDVDMLDVDMLDVDMLDVDMLLVVESWHCSKVNGSALYFHNIIDIQLVK